jgi:pantoate ligase/cytidylate kinase
VRLFKTIAGLRSYLEGYRHEQSIGLVPTMGALHAGHQRLIEQAVRENDVGVVSIFVNPLQFAPSEDLQQYPRQLEEDCQLCQQLGVAAVFAPILEEMGISEQAHAKSVMATAVVPPSALTSGLCAPWRQGHFQGVATILTKLFNIVQPSKAYFGEKDAQQLAIVRRLVADLNFPLEIKACPTVREPSGLALSSRNQYLREAEKEQAVGLFRSLQKAQQLFCKGEREARSLLASARQELLQFPDIRVQYLELVDPQSLTPLEKVESVGLLAIAGYIGSTRLIDNIILRERKPMIAIDGPAGAGKSTVTRRVAQALNLIYLDTGAMYRAIAWLVMQAGIDPADESAIAELISDVTLTLSPAEYPHPPRVHINGQEVTEAIRTPQVTALVSQVAAQAPVRRLLVALQQRYGEQGGIVAEGRDIGTNVFPDADLKIFLTASAQERARRRWLEFQTQEQAQISLEQLAQDIQARDERDTQRKIAPLRKAIDALEINTDNLSIEAVTETIINLYEQSVR